MTKRRMSSLHAFSILAFGTSAGLDSQSLPFSSTDPFIVLQVKGNSVTLVMFDREPTPSEESAIRIFLLRSFMSLIESLKSRDAYAES